MILEEETFKRYGYYPNNLSYGSGKRILAKCDICDEIRELPFRDYRKNCLGCALKTKEHGENISKSLKGRKFTKEWIENLKKARHKVIMSDETKEKIRKGKMGNKNPFYGKHHSEETKQKMRDSHPDTSGINNPMYGKFNELSSNWRGGLSFEPYCIKFNDDLKERVREFFDRKCYICGKNEFENDRKMCVHHVNYDKMICCNDIEPLFVPLCMSCHGKTNSKRNEWEKFFEVSLSYLTNNKCYYSKEEMKKL